MIVRPAGQKPESMPEIMVITWKREFSCMKMPISVTLYARALLAEKEYRKMARAYRGIGAEKDFY